MAPGQPPIKKMKFSMDSFSLPIKILVGAEKKEFYIQKALICAQSEFFKAACNDNWESGRTNTVTLEEDKPDEFSIFLTWIYTGRLEDAAEFITIPEKKKMEKVPDERNRRFLQLARCFVLGDVLLAANFRNAIVDTLIHDFKLQGTHGYFIASRPSALEYVYKNTSPKSPLRRLVIDIFVSLIEVDFDAYWADQSLSAATLVEFYHDALNRSIRANRTCEKLTSIEVLERDSCIYHNHPEESEGYSCTMSSTINSASAEE